MEPDEALEPKEHTRIAVDMLFGRGEPARRHGVGRGGGATRAASCASRPARIPLSPRSPNTTKSPLPGDGPRGVRRHQRHLWVSLASGHLGRFDRSKCKVLNGPTATGKHCPEGWTFHALPGRQLGDVKVEGSAEVSSSTGSTGRILGLGKNVPIAMGDGGDAVYALVEGEFITLHLPYPMGFFPKSLDGRIDDEKAGWKGRGLWHDLRTRGRLLPEPEGQGRRLKS